MAYDFDGTDDYIEALSAPVSGTPLTMACWFYPDNATANMALVSLNDGTGSERFQMQALGATAGDPMRAQSIAGGVVAFATGPAFVANAWQHAAAVFTSSTSRRMFTDGVPGVINTTSSTPTGITQTDLGCTVASSARTAFLNGRLAEVGIWNIALTVTEVEALAKGFRPTLISPANLVLYVPLVREVADYRRGISLTASAPVVIEHPRRIG